MVFPVVLYGCEIWTIKKAERQRIDAFELWCWRRFLRVPLTARRSNQSILIILNIHWEDGCQRWNSNTLATWCKELTHLKRSWCWEGLKVGGEGDDREWYGWMASPTQWTWVWLWLLVMDREAWRAAVHGSQRVGHDWATELNWTELKPIFMYRMCSCCVLIRIYFLDTLAPSRFWKTVLFPSNTSVLPVKEFHSPPCWCQVRPCYHLYCLSLRG